MRCFVLTLACVCFGLTLSAKDACSREDLYEIADSPLSKIPIYQNPEFCYALATTELMNYHLIFTSQVERVHPVYAGLIAHNSKYTSSTVELSRGHAIDVYNAVVASGTCAYNDVEARIQELREASGMQSDQLVAILDQLHDLPFKLQLPDHRSQDTLLEMHDKVPQCAFMGLAYFLSSSKMLNMPALSIMSDLLRSCHATPVNLPKAQQTVDIGQSVHRTNVDRNLTQHYPTVVSLCRQTMEDANYKTKLLVANAKITTADPCQLHDALVVGRNVINGECSYLVRNSKGPYWNAKGSAPCACTTQAGEYQEICKEAEPKEFLGCWYSDKRMFNNVEQTIGLK